MKSNTLVSLEEYQEVPVRVLSSQRFLALYSGVLTLCFVATVVAAPFLLRSPTFGVITAQRINIVEPDGTVRLTISNRASFPGTGITRRNLPGPIAAKLLASSS